METIYKNCKLYGPYTSKQDGRQRIVLIHEDGRRQFISYPKYLVEKYLNCYLDDKETVDHIDGDFTNNDLSNLRVVDRSKHVKEDVKRVEDVETICIWCGTPFTIKGNTLHHRNRRTASGFCSRSCTGKYGASVQNKRVKKINNKIEFEKTYYTKKSALEEISNVEEQNIGEALTRNGDGNTEA